MAGSKHTANTKRMSMNCKRYSFVYFKFITVYIGFISIDVGEENGTQSNKQTNVKTEKPSGNRFEGERNSIATLTQTEQPSQ